MMQPSLKTACALVTAFATTAVAEVRTKDPPPPKPVKGPYVAMDAGTSFSPHGFGGALGYAWAERGYWAEIGTGLSKKGIAGWPVSLEVRMTDFPVFAGMNSFFGLGATYYQGSGRRTVVFEADTSQGDAELLRQASWRFLYLRSSLGLWRRWDFGNLPAVVFMDAGVAWCQYAKVEAKLGEYDQSNVGVPIGISTEDHYDVGYLGQPDTGVYARVGVTLFSPF